MGGDFVVNGGGPVAQVGAAADLKGGARLRWPGEMGRSVRLPVTIEKEVAVGIERIGADP